MHLTRFAFVPPAHCVAAGVLTALLAVAAGCQEKGPANVGQVSGRVTLAGEPLADAHVTFAPVQQGGTTALGRTGEDGAYALSYASGISGAEIGENRVLISTYSSGNPDGDPPRPAVPEKVPARYNAKTELKVEVKAGGNTFDFPLEAGPVIQPSDSDASRRRPRSDGC